MDPRLKQRLVGASVLVALAVIFLPELLRSPGEGTMSSVELEIPPPPEPSTNLKLPPPPSSPAADPSPALPRRDADEEPRDAPATTAEEAPGQSAANAQPAPTPRAIPMEVAPDLAGWVVQVGSFTDPENAERLQARLRGGGFAAFTESVESDGRTWRRVRVGPELSRADAERLQSQLESRFGIDGLVRKHP